MKALPKKSTLPRCRETRWSGRGCVTLSKKGIGRILFML